MELGSCFLLAKVEVKSYFVVQSFQKSVLLAHHRVNGFASSSSMLPSKSLSESSHSAQLMHCKRVRRQLYETSTSWCHDTYDPLALCLALQTSDCSCFWKKKTLRHVGNGWGAKLHYCPLNKCIRLRITAQLPVKGLIS